MDQIIADVAEETPVVRFYCPECCTGIEQKYALTHGERLECGECGEHILFTFITERVPP